MSSFAQDSSRTDVLNLLKHTADVLGKYASLDALRAEPTVDTFESAVIQLKKESSRYLESFRLAVVGDFKVGKSSLINALLAQKNLVAEGVSPTTGAVTELAWGETASGLVLDDKDQVLYEGDIEGAARYADQRQPEGRKFSGKGIRVILKQPTEVLRHLTIFDTPGLGANELDDQVTLGSLHLADAAILVLGAGRVGGDSPVQMAERLRTANKQVTLVITRSDLDADHGQRSAADMSEVFRDVIDGPPIIFSSTKVQEALDKLSKSADERDETLAGEAKAELENWGFAALNGRIMQEQLSSTGSAGATRARAALGELRKRMKSLSVAAAREQDATAKLVDDLTKLLDETERVVLEILDPKVPYLEDRIEDIVDQYVGRLLDTLREAIEVLIDDKLDAGLSEGIKALWARVNDDYDVQRRKDLDRSFKQYFPPNLAVITAQDIERAVTRLLLAEWKAGIKDLGDKGLAPSIGVEDLMKKVDAHLMKVLAAIAGSVAASIALFFVPGGILANIAELTGGLFLAQDQMGRRDARTALVKRQAGLQIKNQRVIIRSQLSAQYRDLNCKVHDMVVTKTRVSSSEQSEKRDGAKTAQDRWHDAYKDLSAILETIADIEQGGL